jgi:hypothetical protein
LELTGGGSAIAVELEETLEHGEVWQVYKLNRARQ